MPNVWSREDYYKFLDNESCPNPKGCDGPVILIPLSGQKKCDGCGRLMGTVNRSEYENLSLDERSWELAGRDSFYG